MTEQKTVRKSRIRVDPWVFGITALIVIGFVVWGLADQDSLDSAGANTLGWITDNVGWLFILSATGFVVFAVYLAASKYGRIPLGKDSDEPEYRTISWIAMMFSAGMGIGLMFFGANEPLFHFVNAPPEMSARDVRDAMATTMFHWGFHPWAMYAVVGLAIAYSTYRCGRGQLMSAVFSPLLGNRSNGPIGKVIDILAIFATLFGTVASLGLGALQIGSGMRKIGWVESPSTMLLVAIIAVLTAAFVASAVSGIARGIQWLSNINMVLALVLAIFVFVVGPTVFIMNLLPTTLGAYLNELPFLAARSGATVDADGESWLSSWTIFYWAWWVSWTPFVGLFLAKISKGRTIREFVIGVMLVPTSVSLVWFAVFGGTAIRENTDGKNLTLDPSEDTLFDVLSNLPLTAIASALVMLLVAIFFVSGADSASIVMGSLSERGAEHPTRTITIFWGVLTGGVAALLLWIGGSDALSGLQTMAIIAALPFVFVMIAMCFSLYKDLRRDPLIVAQRNLRSEIDEHIRQQAIVLASDDGSESDVELADPDGVSPSSATRSADATGPERSG